MYPKSVLLLGLVLFALLSAGSAYATTIRVRANGTGDMPTIRAAAAIAITGDTVLVESGTYYEDSITTSKAIVITGPATVWPTINGLGEPTVILIRPPGGTKVRNLILRNAGVGVLGRSDDCAAVAWTAEYLVLDSLEVGLDADNSFCRVGSATWTNCTATRCGVGYMINDYGSVTGSGLVAFDCGMGSYGHNYNSASLNCIVFHANDVNAGGTQLLPFTNMFAADPLFCDLTHGDFRVATASPALAANNACGVAIGALGLGCTTPVSVGPADAAGLSGRVVAWPVPSRGDVVFAAEQRDGLSGMEVYDLLGRQVWRGDAAWAGRAFSWKPRDSAGHALAPGVYLARFGSGGERTSVRFVIAK